MIKGICYFGSYDSNYSRNRIILKGLSRRKIKVFEVRSQGMILGRYFNLVKTFIKSHDLFDNIIVGFPGHFDVFLAFILGRIFKKKVFFNIFTSTYETYVLDREVVDKRSIFAFFYFLLDWLNLYMVDYVITDTKTHLQMYQNLYGLKKDKGVVIYVGSDNDIFYPMNLKETTDVLFYGSYQPLQGVKYIIEAAALLPRVKFRLIGKGQTRPVAEKLVDQLKLKNIEFVEWVSLKQLSIEINKAKVILGIFGESKKAQSVIPNKVYDAVACKKVFVSLETKGMLEFFKSDKNCILIDKRDQLKEAIMKLLKNKSLRYKLSTEAYWMYRKNLIPENVVLPLI